MILALTLAGCSEPTKKKQQQTEEPAPTTTTTPKSDPLQEARAQAATVASTGDFDKALAVLDAAIAAGKGADDKDLAVARCDRAAVLSQRAAQKTTEPKQKERDLRAAVADCPTEPVLTSALANTLLLRSRELADDSGNRALRRSLLEESMKLKKTAAAAVDLAKVCDDDDDVACAAAAAEDAVALAPGDARVVALRDRLKRVGDVEGAFKSARHSHFTARFEGYGEERLAWTALDILETNWFTVGNALDLRPKDPVTVVIYTGAQYQQATATPDWSAGVFDGKIRIREGQLAAERGSLEDTLIHEYVHAALRNCVTGDVPTWFHEGLAQHFEKQRPEAKALLAHTGKAPLPALSQSFLQLNEADARAAYATSLALVEALVDKRGVYGLQQLLAEMKQDRSFDDALQRAFATTTAQLWNSL